MYDRQRSIPVLNESLRWQTDPVSGKAAVSTVANSYRPDIYQHAKTSLWLGDQYPLYEVAMDGVVYRMTIRRAGSGGRFEVLRCVAAGFNIDGVILEPVPTEIPNTPMALIREIALVTGASIPDVVERAYSICDYRKYFDFHYPQTMEPVRYRFREWFLAIPEGGDYRSLYDTPATTGRVPTQMEEDKWTMFLQVLDSRDPQHLVDYVAHNARKEFPESVVPLMMQALRLRNGHEYTPGYGFYARLIDGFKLSDFELRAYRTGPKALLKSRPASLGMSFHVS
jgi:hypothetical protein